MTLLCIENVRTKLLLCLLAFLLPLAPLRAQTSQGAVKPPKWGMCYMGDPPPPWEARKTSVTKLADNVYVFRSPYYENTLIVVGKDGVLITDTFNDQHGPMLKKAIATITDKPVTKIVLSHEHFDHIGGTRYWAGAKIIAQKNILPMLAFDPLHRGPAKIDVTFDKELSIDMGTTKVELRYWGMTEGLANIVTYLPKEKIALLSDLTTGERAMVSFLGLSDTNMLGLRLVLNEVLKWDLKYLVDAHSETTDLQPTREYAQFINDLYDAVLPVVKKANETSNQMELWHHQQYTFADSIKLPKYKDWKNYDKEMPSYVMWMASSILYNGL